MFISNINERFFDRFRGTERAHTGFTPSPTPSRPGEKAEASYSMLHQPMTAETWHRHLAGTAGAGLNALLEDGTVWFATIDIDNYQTDLPALAIRVADLGLPLIVFRSKSGGPHLYVFFKEPASMAAIRPKLANWAATLGAKKFEIFPKQDALGEGDTPPGISLPYFGGEGSSRYAIGPDGKSLGMAEALDLIDATAVTPEAFAAWEPRPIQGHDPELVALLTGAPPCLQALIPAGFSQNRNTAMFDVARLLKAQSPDDLHTRLAYWNDRLCQPPLPAREITALAKQVGKRNYFYKCKEDPIRAVCDKLICKTRAHGIGKDLPERSSYAILNNCLVYHKADGEPLRLANFAARIETDRTVDDGLTTTREFHLSGTLASGLPLPEIDVPARAMLGTWWLERWGADPIVMPGAGQQHLLTAVQTVSAPVQKETIYAHTGWRELDGQWLYLHAGGAIGANGPVDGYEVRPGGELTHYTLPPVRDTVAAVAASLAMLSLGPIGTVALAATYRAPLAAFAECSVSVFITGATGVFKSQVCGLAQAHFGRKWNGAHFPANWSSTPNSLEKLAFAAKDALLVVDDFTPPANPSDAAKLYRAAEQLLRGQGNHAGRQRMNGDGTLRDTFFPRGMILASGEDLPPGHSLRARLVIAEIRRGDVDPAKLTTLQGHAASGLFAEAMAGFVQSLAGQTETLTETLATELAAIRADLTGQHARTPDNIASLLLGFNRFIAFALDSGGLTAEQADKLKAQARRDLTALVAQQDEHQALADPVTRFPDLIAQALAAGMVHLATRAGTAPPDAARCGWQEHTVGSGEYMRTEWRPRGDRIGWMEGNEIWLIPDMAFKAADALERSQGRTLGKSLITLAGSLADAGIIERAGNGRVAKTLRAEGGRLMAWRTLKPDLFMIDVPERQGDPADGEQSKMSLSTPKRPVMQTSESGADVDATMLKGRFGEP